MFPPEQHWYDDAVDHYEYTNGQLSADSPQLTDVDNLAQMLWDKTKKMGCASSLTVSDGQTHINSVCKYWPKAKPDNDITDHVHELIEGSD